MKQSFNMIRHAQAESICYHCLATKGSHVPEHNYSDLSDGAVWKSTVLNCNHPWREEPALASLQWFSIKKVSMDLLHVWHLGVARDLSLDAYLMTFFWVCLALSRFPSIEVFLCMLFQPHLGRGAVDLRIGGCMSKLVKGSAFGQGSVAKRLARAYTRLKTFCKRNGKTVAIKRFSQDNLNLKSKQFPVPGHVESIFCRQLPGFLSDVFGVPKVRRIEILWQVFGHYGVISGDWWR